MDLAVYCDYSYRLSDGTLSAEMPVSLFLADLAPHFDRVVLTGRLDPRPGDFPYRLTGVDFAALPHYSSGARLISLLRSMPSAIKHYWRLLDEVDMVWVLGPTPLALVFAVLTLVRRRKLALGVRQDLPRMFRHRYAGRPLLQGGAVVLEAAFRALARYVPVVVVGPDLARRYRRAPMLHTSYISLLGDEDLERFDSHRRDYEQPQLLLLSVGRLDTEKNPLLLADVLAETLRHDPRWHLHVCGDGPLAEALAHRLADLGVSEKATLHGNVPIDDGLLDLYQSSHALVHVSLSEGVPGVLLEAFATRLPVVATAVGGVPDLVDGCGILVPPRDARAAADAVHSLTSNADLRDRFVDRGAARVRTLTRQKESARLARFLARSSGLPAAATAERAPELAHDVR